MARVVSNNNTQAMSSQVPKQNVLGTKAWHSSITPDMRNHFIEEIKKALYRRLHNFDANTIESIIYEKANSRSEYYRLITEKAYKIRKELDEERQKQQTQQDQSQASTSTATISSQTHATQAVVQTNLQSTSNAPQMIPKVKKKTGAKDWPIKTDLRKNIVLKLAEAFYPVSDLDLLPQHARSIRVYAKHLEVHVFKKANSSFQYYNLIAQEIYKSKKHRQNVSY